jgi:competence protein ComEC
MPVIFLVGILSGVALRSIVYIPEIVTISLFVATCISFVYIFILFRTKCLNKVTFALFLIIFSSIVGVSRFVFAENAFEKDKQEFDLEYVHNPKNKNEFVGVIDEIPTKSEFAISARTKTDHGYVLLRIEKGNDVDYGDMLSVHAQCELPEDFETNTGATFDYDRYLMARDMHHICKVSSLKIFGYSKGNLLQEYLYSIRLWFSDHIDQAFKNPHAGLVKGVLLGDKSGLTTELKSEMTIAGVIHIAVLSGSNIALVATIIFCITKYFSYNARIFLTTCIIVCFVLLSGADPPAVRAGILVLIIFFGKFLHRKPHTGRALLVVAFCMVMWNPFALMYDMSFQLSFLATIGIVYIAPFLENKFKKVTERCGLREILSATLGAQLAVTPLLLYSTGSFSIVSLPANILICWAVPVLMCLGFFGGLLHVFSSFVALPIVLLGELCSNYIIFITKVSAHVPYAQILFFN